MRRPTQLLPESPKMGMILLALMVLLVTGNTLWLVGQSRARMQEQILEEHSLIARHQADTVGAELRGRLRLLESYATRPSIVLAAARGDWHKLGSQLEDLLQVNDDFSGAAYTDARGRIRVLEASDPALTGRESPYRNNFYRALSNEAPYISDAFMIEQGDTGFGITFSARVDSDTGELLGVLQTTAPVTLRTLIPSALDEEDIELFDKSGTPILGDEDARLRGGLTHFGVTEALSGAVGAGSYRDPGSGEEVVGGYAPVPGVQWVLISEEPQGRALASIRPLVYQLGTVGVVVLLAAVALGWLLLRLIRRLTAERNRSQTLLVSIPDGVVVTDESGHITLMNSAMERMTGWSSDEAAGRVVHELIGFSAGAAQRTADLLEETYPSLRAGEVVSSTGSDHTIRSRDGRTIPISWTAAPLCERDEVTGIVTVLRDVSSERESEQLKSSLVSTASHELRTPLTMIQGFAELLSSRELSEPKRREAVAQIYSAAERLGELIDDLLAVSRMESGRLIVEVEEVEVSSVFEDTLADFSSSERSRLDVSLPPLPPLLGDPNALIQVLRHLVSNALKYSPSDGRVELTAKRSGSTIEIVVTDSGIGLSGDEMSHVFEKFYRADNSDVRETPGTGLGLYITRNLVEMQGGRIWVESERGAGARFYVALPCALQAEAGQEAVPAS